MAKFRNFNETFLAFPEGFHCIQIGQMGSDENT